MQFFELDIFSIHATKKGCDDKGCLLSTEKKAAVDVNVYQLKKAGCTFQLVDVDQIRKMYF